MQQAIDISLNATINATISSIRPIQTVQAPAAAPSRQARVRRHLARKGDLYGVVALMVSSAAYGVFALAQAV